MVEIAAHLVDHVIPPVPVRQWVLSLPKRLRGFPHRDPALAGRVLRILLEEAERELRCQCPGAGAMVFPHRFGAWARLKCEVIVQGQIFECLTRDGMPISLPRDDNQNYIADVWEQDNDVVGHPEDWDEEDDDDDERVAGDGLGLYEEYRGFLTKGGRHQRLEAREKQLFVRDENDIVPQSGFAAISGLDLVYIDDDQWTGAEAVTATVQETDPSTRSINWKTSGRGHVVDQHAVHVQLVDLTATPLHREREEGLVNWRESLIAQGKDPSAATLDYLHGVTPSAGSRSPKLVARVLVFKDEILREIEDTVPVEYELATCEPGIRQEDLMADLCLAQVRQTTAHEMAHAVGVGHHAADEFGKYGGDPTCIMRYFGMANTYSLCKKFEPQAWPYRLTPEPHCERRESCWAQVRVSDDWQW